MVEKKLVHINSVEEALKFAVKGEVEAHDFYAEWSQKINNKAIQLVFSELANEETKHKEFLLSLKSGQSLKPSDKGVADLKISEYTTDVKASTDMDYQDALTLAMHKEKEAFKLYTGLAALTDDPQLSDTFKALAQEEARHKLRLELMYDDEILKEN